MVIVWIIFAVLLGVIEAVTLGLFTLWFAVGALVAAGFAILEYSIWSQLAVFVLVSTFLLLLTFKIVNRNTRIEDKSTNFDMIIGETGVVVEEINNFKEVGAVRIMGKTWTAVSYNDKNIEIGNGVEIIEIKGAKVVVRENRLLDVDYL